ncbi:putative D-2-hydroxyglutarate dehydrogenase mitochondrial [Bienertia sinuspersici]
MANLLVIIELANYCGALVKDPLNAPLYEGKFDIGIDDQEEEERKNKYTQRRKFIMESLNKKYRNFRAILKSDYYDTEETDEYLLKEENMPTFFVKKDWEWLVKYFGSEEFRNEMKRLLEQQKAGQICLTYEEIYVKIKPKGKCNSRDHRTGVIPSITSLFGGFSECEKLCKEADKAKNEAAEANKEAISANEQNKIFTKKLKDVERDNKVIRHYLEKFLNTLGYNLSEFNMDEDFKESNEQYENKDDKDEEEIRGNDRKHE